MSNFFEKIERGLNEAIAFEAGTLDAKVTKRVIEPVVAFCPSEIKAIRGSTGMSQKSFAMFMGVSVKTVEAWEHGTNKPAGPACRLLQITKNDPKFPEREGIVSAST